MGKVVMNIPYGEFVIDSADALTLCEVLAKAERYRENYKNSQATYHIYPYEGGNTFGFRLLTDDQYRLYRLAGKPEE